MSTIDKIISAGIEIGEQVAAGYTGAAEERVMRELIAAALADARREGAEAMLVAAAHAGFDAAPSDESAGEVYRAIHALPLPLPTGPRQAVRLTDGQMRDAQMSDAARTAWDGLMDHIYEYGTCSEGEDYHRRKFARAIEDAVFAANGLEGGAE